MRTEYGVKEIIEKGYQIIYEDIINQLPNSMKPENANIVAILPISELILNDKKSYHYLIKLASALLKQIISKFYTFLENLKNTTNFKWINRKTIKDIDSLDIDKLMQRCLK